MSNILPPSLFTQVGIAPEAPAFATGAGQPAPPPVSVEAALGGGAVAVANIPLGTTVSVHDRSNANLPYTGIVVQFFESMGVAQAPAIIVQTDNGESTLVTDTGQYEVRVIASGIPQGPATPPQGLRKVRRRVQDALALRYDGNPAIGAQINAYARGQVRTIVEEGALLRIFIGGVSYAVSPGDVILIEGGQWSVIDAEEFSETYDIA